MQLVTGGSGYFGAFLVEQLRQADHPVRVFDLVDIEERHPNVQFIQGDICDYEQVYQACKDVSLVYHCVAQVPLAKNKKLFHDVNILGTENLLRAALAAKVQKIVLLSSSAVFGIPERNPVDDTVHPRPLEDYGRSKLQGEQIAHRYHTEHNLDVTIIRPRTILGHGRLGIFQILFDWIFDGKDVYVLGKGDNLYQFVHAEDLADACIKSGQRPGYSVYNIGAERYCSMRESLEGLIAHADTGSQVRSLPMGLTIFLMQALSKMRLAPFAPYHWLMYGRELYFSIERAKHELHWQPKWGNIEMLRESYDWYVNNRLQIQSIRSGSPHRQQVKQGVLKLVKWLLPPKHNSQKVTVMKENQ